MPVNNKIHVVRLFTAVKVSDPDIMLGPVLQRFSELAALFQYQVYYSRPHSVTDKLGKHYIQFAIQGIDSLTILERVLFGALSPVKTALQAVHILDSSGKSIGSYVYEDVKAKIAAAEKTVKNPLFQLGAGMFIAVALIAAGVIFYYVKVK
jgi:hypothetical protein